MSTAVIKPNWSPLNIALMVLGFVFFWPLGLAMLAYILWGEHYGGSSEKAEKWMKKQKFKMNGRGCHGRHSATGNAAFDEYREAEIRRLQEERMRLEEERAEFEDFLRNLHMARDRDEFDSFKSAHKAKRADEETTSRPKKKKRDTDLDDE